MSGVCPAQQRLAGAVPASGVDAWSTGRAVTVAGGGPDPVASANNAPYPAAMKFRTAWVCLLLWATACGDDETPRELDLSLGTARVSARMDPADGLALLDITAQLEASVDLQGARVEAVTLSALPDGPELDFEVSVRGPQDASRIDLPAGDTIVARISNAGTTNAELLPLCNVAATVTVVVVVEDLERTASRDLTVGCS